MRELVHSNKESLTIQKQALNRLRIKPYKTTSLSTTSIPLTFTFK